MNEEIRATLTVDTTKATADIKNLGTETEKLKKQLEKPEAIKLSVDIAELKIKMEEAKRQLAQYRKEWNIAWQIELHANIALLQRDLTQAGRALTNFLRTWQQDVSVLGKMFSSVWNSIMTAFWIWSAVAVISKFTWAINESYDAMVKFEKSIQLVKTVAKWSSADFKQLEVDIKNIAVATWTSAQSLADTAFYIASAWVPLKEIPQTLELISKASIATWSTSQVVFDGMYSVAQSYWYGLKDLSQISDMFFQANADGMLTMEWLSWAIWNVASTARTAGVPLNDLIAWFSTLTGVTGDASEVSTQLKWVLVSISAPSELAARTAKAYGIELGSNAIKEKWYAWVLKDVFDKTNWNLDIIAKIIPAKKGLAAAVQLGSKAYDEYVRKLDNVNNSLWETDKVSAEYLASTTGQLQQAGQAFTNFWLTVWWVLYEVVWYAARAFNSLTWIIGKFASDLKISWWLSSIINPIWAWIWAVKWLLWMNQLQTKQWDFSTGTSMLDSINKKIKEIKWQWTLTDIVLWNNDFTKKLSQNLLAFDNTKNTISKTAENLDWLNEKLENYKKDLWSAAIWSDYFKDIQKNIKDTQAQIDKATWKEEKVRSWMSPAEKKKQKDEIKRISQQALDDIQRANDDEVLSDEEAANKVLEIKTKLEDDILAIEWKNVELSSRKAERTKKELEIESKNAKEIKRIKDEALVEQKKIDDDSSLSFIEKAKKKEDIATAVEMNILKAKWKTYEYEQKVSQENSKLADKRDSEYQKINQTIEAWYGKIKEYWEKIVELKQKFTDLKESALQDISEISVTINATTKTALDDLSKRFVEINKQLQSDTLTSDERNKLETERQYIISNVTQSVLDQATAYWNLSEAQKIVKKRDEEILALKEKQSVAKAFGSETIDNPNVKAAIDANGIITATYKDELGNLVTINDLKNQQYALDLVNKTSAINQDILLEQKKIDAQISEEQRLINERTIMETQFTEFFKSQLKIREDAIVEYKNAMIAATQEMLNLWVNLQWSLKDSNAAWLSTVTTNNSKTNSIWVVNVNNWTDVTSLLNKIQP